MENNPITEVTNMDTRTSTSDKISEWTDAELKRYEEWKARKLENQSKYKTWEQP